MALLRRRSKTLNYDWDTLRFPPEIISHAV